MNFARDNLAIRGFHEIGSRERFRSHGFNAQLQSTGVRPAAPPVR